jgi:tRNA (cytidine/uridine-2'-O-)-methyltransferase
MIHIALWEPEIPPNTGNIARLCAATASPLHLIGRLGFRLDERSLRRAGLDYWDAVELHCHASQADFEQHWTCAGYSMERVFCFSAHAEIPSPVRGRGVGGEGESARAIKPYTAVSYQDGDCLLFGAETRGLPPEMIQRFRERVLTIPMLGSSVRSLNLATAAGIALYEVLRQLRRW